MSTSQNPHSAVKAKRRLAVIRHVEEVSAGAAVVDRKGDAMENYQRAFIGQMAVRLDLYDSGEIPLSKLAEDLCGLFDVADPRDLSIRDSFGELWAELDAESELRTEAWAPPGPADDTHLLEVLHRLRSWIDWYGLAT